MAPDPSFWKGRRVFLTGHTGFKGSWLSLWLDALGASVTGYALPGGVVGKLADAFIVKRMNGKSLEDGLNNLKALVERQ